MAFSTSVLVVVNQVPHADIIHSWALEQRNSLLTWLLPLSMVTQEIQLNPQGQLLARGSNQFLVGTEVDTLLESSVLFLLTTGVVFLFYNPFLFFADFLGGVGLSLILHRS